MQLNNCSYKHVVRKVAKVLTSVLYCHASVTLLPGASNMIGSIYRNPAFDFHKREELYKHRRSVLRVMFV